MAKKKSAEAPKSTWRSRGTSLRSLLSEWEVAFTAAKKAREASVKKWDSGPAKGEELKHFDSAYAKALAKWREAEEASAAAAAEYFAYLAKEDPYSDESEADLVGMPTDPAAFVGGIRLMQRLNWEGFEAFVERCFASRDIS